MVKSVLFVQYKAGHEADLIAQVEPLYQFLELHVRHEENDAIVFLDSKDEATAEGVVQQLGLHWVVDGIRHMYVTNEVKSDFMRLPEGQRLAVFLSNVKPGDEAQGVQRLAGFEECRDVLFIDGPNNVLITGAVDGIESAWKLGHDLPRNVRYLGHTETYVMAQSVLRR